MNRKWFYRQLISYVPIFLLITSFLAYIAFFSLSEMSKKSAQQINEMATGRLLQLVDHSLQEIDKLVLKEMSDNSRLLRYFYGGNAAVLKESEASDTIRSWMVFNPLIHSAYLYRKSDDIVLTNTLRVPLSQFADAEFLIQQTRDRTYKPWSNPRMYRDSTFQGRTEQVVSMVKPVPVSSGELGVLVVNVKTSDLQAILNPPSDSQLSFIELYDSKGLPFRQRAADANLKVLTELRSDYTGWTIRSGIGQFRLSDFSESNLITTVAIAVLSIVIGTVWFIFVIRLNYKPIGTIMDRLKSATQLKGKVPDAEDSHELQIIETALDNLIRQSIDYEKAHEEDLLYRRKVFFHEVLQGNRTFGPGEWERELEILQLPSHMKQFRVVLIEIDKYARFCSEYNQRDQNLLKFAMGNIVKEMASSMSFTVWMEWLESSRLGLLFMGDQAEEQSSRPVAELCERIRSWVQQHLKFSVTIGIGDAVDKPEHILLSFGQAEDALENKIFAGTNRVILFEETPDDPLYSPIHEYLPEIRRITRMYRMGEPEWQDAFNELFRSFRHGGLSRDDVVTLVNVVMMTFFREIAELPMEYKELWKTSAMPAMNDAFVAFDSVEEVRVSFLESLRSFENRMKELRESRQYVSVVEQVRRYIDENYGNPDLSLAHLGDAFAVNPKYLSYMFKEQLGVKFVDYLATVRMEYAKGLLESTDYSIPDIANRVGYVHAVSFNRVFKKMVGQTPGEYRSRSRKDAI